MDHTSKNMILLQDTTKVGHHKWSDIRKQAMEDGFEKSKKFESYTKEEQ